MKPTHKKLSDEIGTLKTENRPQSLSNTTKGQFFKTSYEFFKEWNEKSDKERENINPMEKMGIYCIVFSMLEDRIETLWWNCSFVHEWDVIESYSHMRKEKIRRPPREDEHRKRKIPKNIRTTGRFRKDLLENGKITIKLHDKIVKTESDRSELIHRNMFFIDDLTDKHLKEVMSLFRELDKLVQKHKKGHPDIFL